MLIISKTLVKERRIQYSDMQKILFPQIRNQEVQQKIDIFAVFDDIKRNLTFSKESELKNAIRSTPMETMVQQQRIFSLISGSNAELSTLSNTMTSGFLYYCSTPEITPESILYDDKEIST